MQSSSTVRADLPTLGIGVGTGRDDIELGARGPLS